MSDKIDIAVGWIEQRNAVYICKEDKVVYYEKEVVGDEWCTLTLAQAVRVIKCSVDIAVTENHLMSAFQELGEVYERGLSSDIDLPNHIFNYKCMEGVDELDKLISQVIYTVSNLDCGGAYLNCIHRLISKSIKSNVSINIRTRKKLVLKNALERNMVVRSGKNRASIKGRKHSIVIRKGAEPSKLRIIRGQEEAVLLNMIEKLTY